MKIRKQTGMTVGIVIAGVLCTASARATPEIHGTVDTYIERTVAGNIAAVRMDSSGLGVSRLFVRESSEVAPGITALVYLEGRLDLDSGKAAGDGSMFNRMQYLALQSAHARLSVGKQYSPHLLQLASEYDIFETSFWGTPYAIFQGASRYTLVPDSVALELRGAGMLPLKLSAMWADRKEEPGKAPAGTQTFVALLAGVTSHLNVGFTLVRDRHFSYEFPEVRVKLVGFNYTSAKYRLSAGFQTIIRGVHLGPIREFCIGAGFWLNPTNQILFNHAVTYEPDTAGSRSKVLAVSYIHHLSKSTALYASVGGLRNGEHYQNYFDVPTKPGQSTRNIMAGIRQNF
jgi:predicted porin